MPSYDSILHATLLKFRWLQIKKLSNKFDCRACNFFPLDFQTVLPMLLVMSLRFQTKWGITRYVSKKVLSQHILAIMVAKWSRALRESKFFYDLHDIYFPQKSQTLYADNCILNLFQLPQYYNLNAFKSEVTWHFIFGSLLYSFPRCYLFLLLPLVTPCLAVAFQPCIKWIPHKKTFYLHYGSKTNRFCANSFSFT